MIDFLTAFIMLCALPVGVAAGYIAFKIVQKGACAAWQKIQYERLMAPKSVFYRMEGVR